MSDLSKRLRNMPMRVQLSGSWERDCYEAADALDRKDAALRVALEALTHTTNCYIGVLWSSGDDAEGSGAVKAGKNAIAAIEEALDDAAAQEDSNGS